MLTKIKKDEKSNFAKHLICNCHSSDFKMNILKLCNDRRELDSREQLEILKIIESQESTLINEYLYSSFSPILASGVLKFIR